MKPFLFGPILAALCACAGVPPPAPAPRALESLDAVTVVASAQPPKAQFTTFAKGAAEGAGKGATYYGGVTAGTALAFSTTCGPYAPMCALLGLMYAGVEAAAGAVAGAISAVPKERAEEIEYSIQDAVAKLGPQRIFATRVAALASIESRREVHSAEAPLPGARSVLQVAIEEIGFQTCEPEVPGLACPYDPKNPVVALYMVASVRLVRADGGAELYARRLRTTSPRRLPQDWSADGGKLLAEAFEAGYWDLAARVVDELFLAPPYELPWVSSAGKLPDFAAPGYGACWLAPLEPPLSPVLLADLPALLSKQEREVCPAAGLRFTEAGSLQPRLAWSAFPRALDREKLGADELRAIRDVRYDLKIWRVEACERGALVYERTDLPAPEHRVEQPLAPASRYFWTFRARFVSAGRTMATPWASFDPVNCRPGDLSHLQYHRFRTPAVVDPRQ